MLSCGCPPASKCLTRRADASGALQRPCRAAPTRNPLRCPPGPPQPRLPSLWAVRSPLPRRRRPCRSRKPRLFRRPKRGRPARTPRFRPRRATFPRSDARSRAPTATSRGSRRPKSRARWKSPNGSPRAVSSRPRRKSNSRIWPSWSARASNSRCAGRPRPRRASKLLAWPTSRRTRRRPRKRRVPRNSCSRAATVPPTKRVHAVSRSSRPSKVPKTPPPKRRPSAC